MSRTRWTYLGLVLLAVGLVTAGTGAATHLSEKRCANAGFVRVVDTDRVNGSLAAYDRLDYADLTDAEQRVFQSVLDAGGQALAGRDTIREGVVSYENETYLVETSAETGCAPWHRDRVVVPLVAGLAVTAVGLGLTRGVDP